MECCPENSYDYFCRQCVVHYSLHPNELENAKREYNFNHSEKHPTVTPAETPTTHLARKMNNIHISPPSTGQFNRKRERERDNSSSEDEDFFGGSPAVKRVVAKPAHDTKKGYDIVNSVCAECLESGMYVDLWIFNNDQSEGTPVVAKV